MLSPELGVKVQELSKFNASPFVIDQAIYEQTNRLPNSHLMEHYKTSREKPSDLTPTHFEDIQKLFKKGFAIHSVWDSHKHYLHGIIVNYEICKKALFFSNKSNVLFVDATYCIINKDPRSLLGITILDSHGKFHPFAIGVLQNNSVQAYSKLFELLKSILREIGIDNYEPYAITCDRGQSQLKAIKDTFPSTKIVYCRRHLLANIHQNAKNFYQLTLQLLKGIISEDAYLKKVELKYNELMKSANKANKNIYIKQYSYIRDLCTQSEHWFPSFLIKYGLFETSILTSNGIESFFAGLKIYIRHVRLNIDTLFMAFCQLSKKKFSELVLFEESLINLKKSKKDEIQELYSKYHFPTDLIESSGLIAFEFLLKQIDENCFPPEKSDLKYLTFSDAFCFQCFCEDSTRSLPCAHKMNEKNIVIPQCYNRALIDPFNSMIYTENQTLLFNSEEQPLEVNPSLIECYLQKELNNIRAGTFYMAQQIDNLKIIVSQIKKSQNRSRKPSRYALTGKNCFPAIDRRKNRLNKLTEEIMVAVDSTHMSFVNFENN